MPEQKNADGREIRISVKFAYTPAVVRVKQGERVTLVFHREEDSKCTEEVVFPDFSIRKFLPGFKDTRIVLTPAKKGNFVFHCGMDMVRGTLVVE